MLVLAAGWHGIGQLGAAGSLGAGVFVVVTVAVGFVYLRSKGES